MLHKAFAALIVALLCVPAAQAEPNVPKNLDKLIEARDKSAKVWSEFLKGAEMKDAKDMDSFFAKIFGSKTSDTADASDDDDDDYDDSDDDSVAAADEPCVSTADGKPGVSNGNGAGSNGGKGGTVILNGKAATGDCYSANGGNGGSGNYSSSKDNNQTGNGGKGGKIISR